MAKPIAWVTALALVVMVGVGVALRTWQPPQFVLELLGAPKGPALAAMEPRATFALHPVDDASPDLCQRISTSDHPEVRCETIPYAGGEDAVGRPADGRYLAFTSSRRDRLQSFVEAMKGQLDAGTSSTWIWARAGAHETVALHSHSLATQVDIVQAKIVPSDQAGLLAIRFGTAGSKRLANATAGAAAKRLALVIDGSLHSVPIVSGHLTGGALTIAVASQSEAQRLAQRLGGDPGPPPAPWHLVWGVRVGIAAIAGIIAMAVALFVRRLFV